MANVFVGAAPSHDRHTGFADGRVGMRYPLPWFPLSDDTMRCIRRTIRDCRPYRSSHAGCRFGSSGSSGVCCRFSSSSLETNFSSSSVYDLAIIGDSSGVA